MAKTLIIIASIALVILFLIPPFASQVLAIGFFVTILFMTLCATVKKTWLKYAFICIFSLSLPLTLVEGYHYILHIIFPVSSTQHGGVNDKQLIITDDNLGYAANPNISFNSIGKHKDIEAYNVTYTIDDKGRRITPKAPHAKTAIVLLGCSFTFGEGLNDKETFAWQLGEALGEDYQVFNFGLSGYGPHQMLAILEAGIPELASYDKVLAYYTNIYGHQNRITGASPWDSQGPRYLLQNNKAVRSGSFAHNPPLFFEGKMEYWLDKSLTFRFHKREIINRLMPIQSQEAKYDLMRAIIIASAENLHKINVNSHFTVLAWPPNSVDALQTLPKDIPFVDISPWLPGIDETPEKYQIPLDLHPNALACTLVAKKLAKQVKKDAEAYF